MTIDELIEESWQTSEDVGWHDKPKTVGDRIALAHSELSEGLEAHRNDEPVLWFAADGKPEGLAAEYADVYIRLADDAKELGLPLVQAVEAKLAYNKTRPYRHGGKVL